MAFITYPIPAGTKLYALSITGGNLAVSALTDATGANITTSNPLPVGVQGTVAVSVASLPLPSGAALEAGNLASVATNTSRIPAQGQALSAGSMPVVLPVTQDAVAWWGAGNSTPVSWSTAQHVIVDSATLGTVAISAAALPLPSGAAQDRITAAAPSAVRLSDGSAFISTLPVSLASLPALATGSNTIGKVDQGTAGASAWKVDGSSVTQPVSGSVSITGTLPAFASTPTVVLGAGSAAVGSVTVSSSALPTGAATSALQGGGLPAALGAGGGLKVDGSGTALPVSGTVTVQQATAANLNATVTGAVTANIGTSGSLALDATLTGGTAKAIIRGGTKSTTTAADVTSTAASATRQPLDVLLYDSSGVVIGSTANRLITQPHDGTNPSFPAGAAAADASSNATVISQIGARLASYNGSTWDRVRSAVTSIGSTFTGMLSTLPVALYNSTRTTRTTGQGGPLETDSTGALLVQALDGNGNNSALVGGWDSTTNSGSALPAAGLVIKASAGVFGGISAINGTGGAAFLQIHNLSAASGYSASTLVFVSAASVANAAGFSGNALTGGIKCGTGIVAVWSSTQFTYTSIAANTGAVLATYR